MFKLNYGENSIFGFGINFNVGDARNFPGIPQQKVEGTPALIRSLVTHLWKIEPKLSPQYKRDVLQKFLSKWVSINDIETIYSQADLKDLQIDSDLNLLIRKLENPKISPQEQYRGNPLGSPFVKQ